MLDPSRARNRMVDLQIARRGVRDQYVLDAMRRVPREDFVEPGYEEFAYEDGALPISEGQTISQPYIVALMIEAAEIKPGDHVLEVGAGSGYAAAVVSQIADRVYLRHTACHGLIRVALFCATAPGRSAAFSSSSTMSLVFTFAFGPSSHSDATAIRPKRRARRHRRSTDIFLHPFTYVGLREKDWWSVGIGAADGLDLRSRNIDLLDQIDRDSIDPYASLRSIYRQSRDEEIRNGEPELNSLPDF